MSVLFVVNSQITDEEGFDAYRAVVRATFKGHDMEFLSSTDSAETLEGTPAGPRVVIIRFPDRAAFEGWYHSDAYQSVIGLRTGSTSGFALLAEGR
jgi:uncharacterized protein (DUF1330 family)